MTLLPTAVIEGLITDFMLSEKTVFYSLTKMFIRASFQLALL